MVGARLKTAPHRRTPQNVCGACVDAIDATAHYPSVLKGQHLAVLHPSMSDVCVLQDAESSTGSMTTSN